MSASGRRTSQCKGQRRYAGFLAGHEPPGDTELALWVGAGTRDTGFSLTRLTFQITHATDADTNAERALIVGELARIGVIADVTEHSAGTALRPAHVNRYITDGEIVFARLTDRQP